MPRNPKNPSRKIKRERVIVQKGGATTADIRAALWKVRDHWNDLAAIQQNVPNYSNLIDTSRYGTDWGLPSFKAFNDQWALFYANYTIVNNAWTVSYINLPDETAAIGALKTQLTTLYNDCTAQVNTIKIYAGGISAYYTSQSATWLGMSADWLNWYGMYYNASVALIPDAAYNAWKSSGSATYPTDTPTDSTISGTNLSNGLPISLLADTYLTGYNGAANFSVGRVKAYQAFLDYVKTSPITPSLNAIDANVLKAKDIVAQSAVVAKQAQMNIYKLTKAIMGLVIYPDYSTTTPVIFMTAPPGICVYIDTKTWLVYTTTRDKVLKSQAMTDALTGCLEFNASYANLKTMDATIAALPNNSLVKALALKDTIAAKVANLQLTDIIPPPPPPPPSFTGYGKWVDANAQAASSNGQGTIIVVDSSGKNVLLNGGIWTIGGVWTITFNGRLSSYFFSNNVKSDVTILS